MSSGDASDCLVRPSFYPEEDCVSPPIEPEEE
jgi:hypothetical protein